MKKNMSKTDGVIRIMIALIIGVFWYFNVVNGIILIILGIVASIFIITGFINFCPIYSVLGLRTKPKN